LRCLKAWVNQRIDIKYEEDSTMINWKSLNCELCKSPYPFGVYFNELIHELIDYQLPTTPYVIFERYAKETAEPHGLLIASFANKNTLRLGRSIDKGIRLNDVSVSRSQAILTFVSDSLYVQDTNSKFGSLLLMNSPQTLLDGKSLIVQCGKTLLEFRIDKCWSLTSYLGTSGELATKKKLKGCPSLPGEGRHSVLIVSKRSYSKLPDSEKRRANSPGILKINTGQSRKPRTKKMHIEVFKNTFIQSLKGDSPDVNDKDCI